MFDRAHRVWILGRAWHPSPQRLVFPRWHEYVCRVRCRPSCIQRTSVECSRVRGTRPDRHGPDERRPSASKASAFDDWFYTISNTATGSDRATDAAHLLYWERYRLDDVARRVTQLAVTVTEGRPPAVATALRSGAQHDESTEAEPTMHRGRLEWNGVGARNRA